MDEKVIGKKLFIFAFVLFYCFFAVAGVVHAENRTEKAREMIEDAYNLAELDLAEQAKEKMNKAHELLLSELSENSENLEAYFLLGQSEYILKKDDHYKKFKILYRKDKSYGPKIYDFYMDMAERIKKACRDRKDPNSVVFSDAVELRLLAVSEYYPEKADQVIGEIIEESAQYIEDGKFNFVRIYSKKIKEILGEKYRNKVAKSYLERGKALSEQEQLDKAGDFFDFARRMSDKFDTELADLSFEYGKRAEDAGVAFRLWFTSLASSPKHKDDIIEAAAVIFDEIEDNSQAEQFFSSFSKEIREKIEKKARASD